MLAWYRDLIRVRRTVPELRDPRQHRVRTRAHDGEGWMVVERSGVAVVVTLGGDGTRVRVPVPGCGELILATEGAGVAAGGDAVEMPPWGVALVRRAAEGATFRT
jgi:maltooligosyltrehalose trehalohydrolase